ncbi:hypothetical protein O181_081059 [Austropuccinia psidii MF-1]|uniref:Uncharacterized protein n=1 Tax=Austropuccinia psidii MF-1 TaxID=1389203 RepID=A0A9Q3IJR8_9BASI|nr:hypothetical protein [Austropuccinia psidii MF-1]
MPLWQRPHTPLTHPQLTILMLTSCPPNMPPTLPHTGLILSTAYHPYTPSLASRYSSNATLTPPHLHLVFSATYHPYTSILDP